MPHASDSWRLRVAVAGGDAHAVRVPLGPWMVRRFAALHREEPFWMRVAFGDAGAVLPSETQWVLAELSDGRFAVVAPLLCGGVPGDRRVRAVLAGDARGAVLHLDTGDAAVPIPPRVDAVLVVEGASLPGLLETAAEQVQALIGAGRLRRDKPAPALLGEFGWCTWDAFYAAVDADGVRHGLRTLAEAGVRPGFVILDDGWQSVTDLAEGEAVHRARLAGWQANAKFPGDLSPLVAEAKRGFGVRRFLVWHAMQGYWSGVAVPGVPTRAFPRRMGASLDEVASGANAGVKAWWKAQAPMAVPDAQAVDGFFHAYHRHLSAQGVDGVKVDNQATLESLASGELGRVGLMRRWHEALEGSCAVHFGGLLINCMSLSTDMLYQSAHGCLTRSSTDFWPRKPETHGRHLIDNAWVALWFGHFVHPDWDMFQTSHAHGAAHAAARAISGAPVYISDAPGMHDPVVLRRLSTADGRTPRCTGIAVPVPRTVFDDPAAGGHLLMLANTTAAGAVLGVFHAAHARPAISGAWCAGDAGLAGEVAVLGDDAGVRIVDAGAMQPIALDEGGWRVFSLAGIVDGLAILGQPRFLNAGGAVLEAVRAPGVLAATCLDAGEVVAIAPPGVRVSGALVVSHVDRILRLRTEGPLARVVLAV